MHALAQLLAGLVLVHVLWALFYVTGTLLDRGGNESRSAGSSLVDVIVRSLAGAALWGFATFLLGAIGALRWWGVLALVIALGIAFRLRGENPLAAQFWRSRARRFAAGWSWRTLVVYYAVLLTVVPAVLPDIDSDSQRYHLAYPASWANTGKIYVDYLLRASLYADNVELLYALLDVSGVGALAHFLVWFTGALACLGVCAVLQLADERAPAARSALERVARDATIVLVPIGVAISPTLWRWGVTGFVDVPLGAFMFAPVLCASAMLLERRPYFASLAVTAGFVAGAKPSLLVFAPVFMVLAFVAAARIGPAARRAAALAAVAIVLLGSPWYLRNLAVDGDPVPPEFNFLLHRPDKMASAGDAKALRDFLGQTDRSPAALATVPVRAWLSPRDPGIAHGDDGTTGIMVLLYAPFLVLAFALLRRGFASAQPVLVATALVSALGALYWLGLSYNLRYFIAFLPIFATFVGVGLLAVAQLGSVWRWVALATALLCAVPSPSAASWYERTWHNDYAHLETTLPSDAAFLALNLRGYRELEQVVAAHPDGRVYQVRTEMDYEFRRRGLSTLGDWFGAARYASLEMAIDDGTVADYVRHFAIGAFLVDEGSPVLSADQLDSLRRQLRAAGFVELSPPSGDTFYIAVHHR
jgi:hypothetical protein